MEDRKKALHIVYYIILGIAILAVILPVIVSTGYTYPCEDDFGYEAGAKIYAHSYGNFLGALIGAYEYYMNWQGTYVPNFLLYFIRAYDRWGMIGLHLIMISLVLITILAVFLLVQTLIKEKRKVLLILLAVYIIIFNSSKTGQEKEFFYWYTGALTYQLEFALACITLALTVRLKNETRKKHLCFLIIAASITGFIASGGTLEVTSFNCSWLLLALILNYKDVLQKKFLAIPFGVSFVGALINACAKGNFARSHSTMGGLDYGITDALKDTFICWKHEWSSIFENKFLLVLFALIFAACIACKIQIFRKGISTIQMLLIIPAIFLIQYFTAFPVIFGYHGNDLIYSRTTYTYELVVKLMLLFGLICFAQWLREHTKLPQFIPVAASLLLAVYISITNNIGKDIQGGLSYQAAKELCNGKIQELYEFRVHTLALIEESEKGTDVYLKVPGVPPSSIMYGMGLTTDAHSNCNSSAARYYGFNSLRIEYSDEYTFPE